MKKCTKVCILSCIFGVLDSEYVRFFGFLEPFNVNHTT